VGIPHSGDATSAEKEKNKRGHQESIGSKNGEQSATPHRQCKKKGGKDTVKGKWKKGKRSAEDWNIVPGPPAHIGKFNEEYAFRSSDSNLTRE